MGRLKLMKKDGEHREVAEARLGKIEEAIGKRYRRMTEVQRRVILRMAAIEAREVYQEGSAVNYVLYLNTCLKHMYNVEDILGIFDEVSTLECSYPTDAMFEQLWQEVMEPTITRRAKIAVEGNLEKENKNLKEALVKLAEELKVVQADNAILRESIDKLNEKKPTVQPNVLHSLVEDIKGIAKKTMAQDGTAAIEETTTVKEDSGIVSVGTAQPMRKATEGVTKSGAVVDRVEETGVKVVTDPNDTKIQKGVHHKPWEAYGLKKTTYYKRKAEGTLPELKVSDE